MSDNVKGLIVVRGDPVPLTRKMDDGSITKKRPHAPANKKPDQRKSTGRPGQSGKGKAIKIAGKQNKSADGQLARLGTSDKPKATAGKAGQSKSQPSEDRAALGFNDDEVGAATGFLQALLGGGFAEQEPSGRGVPVQGSAPSVLAQDPALNQAPTTAPPGAATANAIPIARGR